MSPEKKFIDVSGYVFSGKSAYSDLLREIDGYHVPEPEFEFELIRIQGGIRDLETALVDDWSIIRADSAIRNFRRVVRRFGHVNSFLNIRSWVEAGGWSYEARYKKKFFLLSEIYIQKLVLTSWNADWPYPMVELNSSELFLRKLGKYLGFKGAMNFDISLAGGDRFIEATNEYLGNLLCADASEHCSAIVTHNAMEPFNPSRGLRYLPNSFSIIIDRDPRDSFVEMLPHSHVALDVDDFIKRFKTLHQQVNICTDSPNRVLRLKYEDLVLDYDQTVRKLLKFLGEPSKRHIHAGRFFNPLKAKKNTQVWKKHHNYSDIKKIADELNQWCDQRLN